MICYLKGIAAANVEIEGTDVAATTIHALLDLNPEMESKLDFTKGNPKTAALKDLDVLFIDEVRSRYSVPSVLRYCYSSGLDDRYRLLERGLYLLLDP